MQNLYYFTIDNLFKIYSTMYCYSDDHFGKVQTRDRKMSTDPGSQNTFWVFFQKCNIYEYYTVFILLLD